jgi:hypothetical protein
MSQGSHPHLKIAELFDVSGLTVAVTVSSMISWPAIRPSFHTPSQLRLS